MIHIKTNNKYMKNIKSFEAFVNENLNEAKKYKSEHDTAVVSESINESTEVDPRVKKECISRLSDFFRVSPNALSHLKFDGKDPIKDVTKCLNATSYEGAEQYYLVAIQSVKRDLGINESKEVNEGKK